MDPNTPKLIAELNCLNTKMPHPELTTQKDHLGTTKLQLSTGPTREEPNLLCISLELRRMIYRNVFIDAPPITFGLSSSNLADSPLRILQINRQIRAEATSMMFAMVEVRIDKGEEERFEQYLKVSYLLRKIKILRFDDLDTKFLDPFGRIGMASENLEDVITIVHGFEKKPSELADIFSSILKFHVALLTVTLSNRLLEASLCDGRPLARTVPRITGIGIDNDGAEVERYTIASKWEYLEIIAAGKKQNELRMRKGS